MRGTLSGMALLGALLAGCSQEEPCADYVDYICECHQDDPDFDCQELRTTYENADPSTQDECAIALDEQEDEDEAAGLDCSV